MAYDALLDCDGKWEKIIFYAILNPSDSSTVGAIAGGFYGAVYGFGDVPLTMLQNIEEGNNLIDLGKKMYKKFY
jgi:ADP-ribosylglycohydrolase